MRPTEPIAYLEYPAFGKTLKLPTASPIGRKRERIGPEFYRKLGAFHTRN